MLRQHGQIEAVPHGLEFSRFENMSFRQNIFALLLIMVQFLAACKPDRCKDVSCANGTCVEGTCICATGYEGELCDRLQSEKYAGVYQLEESCTAGQDSYAVQILLDPSNLIGLKVVGIWEQPDTVQAYLMNAGLQFEVPRQDFGAFEISALGTHAAYGDSIALEYYVFDPGSSSPFDHCTAQLRKP